MGLSPYRFSVGDENNTLGRSRTGLSSVTAGGGGSGGEGYRRSALTPGSRGWMAAGFGNAPQTGYVAPTQTATVTVTPTVTPAAAPAAQAEPRALAEATWQGAEGSGAGGSQVGGPGGVDAGGKPDENGALTGLLGDVSPGRAAMMGAGVGASVAGLPGALVGGLLGFGAAHAFGGDGMASGAGLAGLDAQAAQNTENMAGAMGGPGGFGDARGLANGGRVTPAHLAHGNKAMNKGLHGVKAGDKPQGRDMGGYAMGGRVPNYADGGPVDGAGLAGPNPPGPDDGYAALDGGEYVVRASQAQRPEYGPILDQMNQGTYAPDGSAAHEMGEGGDDLDLAIGQGNMPPAGGEGVTPDDMMQRMATLPPEQRAALQQAATDPMLSGALFALLGPAFMQVIGMLQQPAAPPSPPGMMSMSPDMAGRRPPGGGGLASVNA